MSPLQKALSVVYLIQKDTNAASEGPWEPMFDACGEFRGQFRTPRGVLDVYDDSFTKDDANFVASARNDVPLMIDALKEAEKLLGEARHVLACCSGNLWKDEEQRVATMKAITKVLGDK